MDFGYVAFPDPHGSGYRPGGCVGVCCEDMETTAGQERSLRDWIMRRIQPGDRIRTSSVAAFCHWDMELKVLVRQIIARGASIDFSRENACIGPQDAEHLDSTLDALIAQEPWPAVPLRPAPKPDYATLFTPAFHRAWLRAAEESRKFRARAMARSKVLDEERVRAIREKALVPQGASAGSIVPKDYAS